MPIRIASRDFVRPWTCRRFAPTSWSWMWPRARGCPARRGPRRPAPGAPPRRSRPCHRLRRRAARLHAWPPDSRGGGLRCHPRVPRSGTGRSRGVEACLRRVGPGATKGEDTVWRHLIQRVRCVCARSACMPSHTQNARAPGRTWALTNKHMMVSPKQARCSGSYLAGECTWSGAAR